MRSHYSSFIILCISATIVQCIQFTLVNTACGFQKGSIQTVNCTKIDPSIETLALHPYLTKNTYLSTNNLGRKNCGNLFSTVFPTQAIKKNVGKLSNKKLEIFQNEHFFVFHFSCAIIQLCFQKKIQVCI